MKSRRAGVADFTVFEVFLHSRGLRLVHEEWPQSVLLGPVLPRAGVADLRIITRPSSVVVSLRWMTRSDTGESTSRKSVAGQIDTPTVRVFPPAVRSFLLVRLRSPPDLLPVAAGRTQPRLPARRVSISIRPDADYTAAESGERRRRRRQSNDLLLLPISRRHRIESKSLSD